MWSALLALVVACDFTPATVENSDIDNAVAMKRLNVVCKGLQMKDDDVRRYAAQRLEEFTEAEAHDCLCEAAIDEKNGRWDEAIMAGLKGTDRDDLVECFLPALDEPRNERRLELVVALDKIPAAASRDRLKSIALDVAEESEARKVAIRTLRGAQGEVLDQLLDMLADDEDPVVRAAVAEILKGQKDPEVADALVEAATSDAEGTVRGRALLTLRQMGHPRSDAMACQAMMEDEDPEVRRQAVLSYRGVKREGPMKCLRKRMLTLEEDTGVRLALLDMMSRAPAEGVKPILCDAIPFWVRSYVTLAHPDTVPGTDIITAQNDRDSENSYECVRKAYGKRGGYTCKGKQYVAAWFRVLGGNSHIPICPGDPPPGTVTEIDME